MIKTKELPPFKRLQNGTVIPTEDAIIAIHQNIIEYRRSIGRNDTPAIRDKGLIKHLCDTLADRMHKYKTDPLANAFYVATETFYYIACQHPFHDANKSTAYIAALLVLKLNIITNQINVELANKQMSLEETRFEIAQRECLTTAPKGAEEITRLAEGGQNDLEIKRLIKEFLTKELYMGDKSG